MKKILFVTCGIVLGSLLLPMLAAAAQNPIPVLLVDGQSGGPHHNWRLVTAVVKKALEEPGIFKVTGGHIAAVWRRLQQLQTQLSGLSGHCLELRRSRLAG